jgi:hypothetical protein
MSIADIFKPRAGKNSKRSATVIWCVWLLCFVDLLLGSRWLSVYHITTEATKGLAPEIEERRCPTLSRR